MEKPEECVISHRSQLLEATCRDTCCEGEEGEGGREERGTCDFFFFNTVLNQVFYDND